MTFKKRKGDTQLSLAPTDSNFYRMPTVVSLTEERLDPASVIAAAGDVRVGAVASFVGTVRSSSSVDASSHRSVIALFYEAHPVMAEKRLNEIVTEAVERWGLASVVVIHRLGRCELGEPTVAIACGSAHREEAFVSCRWIIEELKESVPIWKCEIYKDGESWIGMGS